MISLPRGVKYLLLALMFVALAAMFAIVFAVIGLALVSLSLTLIGTNPEASSRVEPAAIGAVVLAALFGVYLAQRIGRADLRRSYDADWNRLGALLDAIAATFSFRR